MTSDTHPLIQQMVDNAPYGTAAKQALERLSVFLTEPFGGPAIQFLLPYSRDEQVQIVATLQDNIFLHKINRRPRNTWYERYHPWSVPHHYNLDPEVVAIFQPDPSDQDRHFAKHAAFLFRADRGITNKALETYLALIDWTEQHHPEMVVYLASLAANRYGGTDTRLSERLYQIAHAHNHPVLEIKMALRMGRITRQGPDPDISSEWYRRVLMVNNPQNVTRTAIAHSHALEQIGHLERMMGQWKRARQSYDEAFQCLTQVRPHHIKSLGQLLWLCQVTQKQGDKAAYEAYNKQVAAVWRPSVKQLRREIDKFAGAHNFITKQRQAFARNLLDRETNQWRRGLGSGDVLWHWGRFESVYGDRAEGLALCQMALLRMEREIEETTVTRRTKAHVHVEGLMEYMRYIHELSHSLDVMTRTRIKHL